MQGACVEELRYTIEDWQLKTKQTPVPIPLGVLMLAAKREGFCIYKGTKSQQCSMASVLKCAAGKTHRDALQRNQPPLTKAQKKAAQVAAQATAENHTMNEIFGAWGWAL